MLDATLSLKQAWRPHPQDARVRICDTYDAAVKSIRQNIANVHRDSESATPLQTLQRMGYKELDSYTCYSHKVVVTADTIKFENEMHKDLQALIAIKVKKMSEALGMNEWRLTMGNVRNEKLHLHISHTLTGAIINQGTQWEINNTELGQVANGDDFYIPPHLMHRSTPVKPNEERFIWALTSVI